MKPTVERWKWWWEDVGSCLRKNADFARWGFWLNERLGDGNAEALRPLHHAPAEPADRQIVERLFWLYEADARIRGTYLFGKCIADLDDCGFRALYRPLNPFHGIRCEYTESLRQISFQPMSECGVAIRRSAKAPVEPAGITPGRNGWTPLAYVYDVVGRRKSAAAVAINLHAADRVIERDWKVHAVGIGVEVSRRRLRAWVRELRTARSIAATQRPRAGQINRPVSWDQLKFLELPFRLEVKRNTSPGVMICQMERLYRERAAPLVKAWENSLAGVEIERRSAKRRTNN